MTKKDFTLIAELIISSLNRIKKDDGVDKVLISTFSSGLRDKYPNFNADVFRDYIISEVYRDKMPKM